MLTWRKVCRILIHPRSDWLIAGVVCGLILMGFIRSSSFSWPDPVRQQAWNRVAPRVESARDETRGEADVAAAQIEQFFIESRSGADAFAADMLSWGGKWEFVKDYFGAGDHQQYIQLCFERHIFRSDELKDAIESAVASYVSAAQGHENQLLIDIRADLADSALAAPGYLPELDSEVEFRRVYEEMIARILPVVSRDVGTTVAREVAAFVAGEIAARIVMEAGVSIATQLGISGGVLGAGASSAAFTFGAGLIAGILVDMALDWVIRQAGYNPEGEVAAKVRDSLDRLEQAILDGDSADRARHERLRRTITESWWPPAREEAQKESAAIEGRGTLGLRHQLYLMNDARARLREAALRSLILKGGEL